MSGSEGKQSMTNSDISGSECKQKMKWVTVKANKQWHEWQWRQTMSWVAVKSLTSEKTVIME